MNRFVQMYSRSTMKCLPTRKGVESAGPRAKLRMINALFLAGGLLTSTAIASTWTNLAGNGDWNDPLNWGAGDFTGGVGVVPDQAGSIGVAVGAVPLTINQSGLNSLYMIVNNTVDVTGGDLVFTGDGLWGSGIGAGGGGDPDPDGDPAVLGSATVNQTGGTITQTGGGAGFLVGHNRPAVYNISGGSIIVQETAPSLMVDWTVDGTVSTPSVLNISGDAVVDVHSRFAIGPQGAVNISENGVLIWRNHVVEDLRGMIAWDHLPEPLNAPVPVRAPGGILSARAIQVGPDVHLLAVPEPAGIILLAIAGVMLAARRS